MFDKIKIWVLSGAVGLVLLYSSYTTIDLVLTKNSLNRVRIERDLLKDQNTVLEKTIENNESVIASLQDLSSQRDKRNKELEDSIRQLDVLPTTATCGPSIDAAYEILRERNHD